MPGPKQLAVRAYARAVFGPQPGPRAPYAKDVAWAEEGNAIVAETLREGGAVLAARFGSTELSCVVYRERWRRGALSLPYPSAVRRNAHVASGICPTDDESLDRFCEILLGAARDVDVLGVWHNRSEHVVVSRYAPNARLVELNAMNAVLWRDPWTRVLEGRRVLVVHPFAKTIASQYRERRTLLFDNPKMLPAFELTTYVPVQTIAGNAGRFGSWFEGLEHMKREIGELEFDVAIIGAGAYGLPLGAHVKSMGRQAVHLGGNTQLMFGIRGRRWEVESPDVSCLFNEYWVRPAADERPEGFENVEGGCYW